ncbi:MAG: RNA polymerase sigma factor [Chloroflexota bacterium]
MADLSSVDEQQLVRWAQNGDAAAFGELYERHAGPVFRFLFAHLDDRLDAEDLTEEVFLRAWQALPGFAERGVPFRGFLLRVARNALYDTYRRDRRRPPAQVELDGEDDLHAGPAADPAESVPEQMEHARLHSLLEHLREDHRQVLSLRFLAGLTPDETAQAMGKSAGAVRVLQHRALAAFKLLLAYPEQDGVDGSETQNELSKPLPARRRSGPAAG